ncbi:MAG: hypothetical protein IKI25_00675, partial [Bacteroidales bacterium]|nr:hypothetical protein [Bacteroidales bacterium]MBR7034257.1 hypothetical protein [Bacteroidales bacterium]
MNLGNDQFLITLTVRTTKITSDATTIEIKSGHASQLSNKYAQPPIKQAVAYISFLKINGMST